MDKFSLTVEGYKENKVVSWITAILLYMLLYPYFIWPFVDIIEWIVLLPLYIIFFFNSDWKKDIVFFVLFILITLFIGFNQKANIFGFFFLVAVSVVYVAKKGFVFSVYKHFWQIYVAIMTLSLLSMLLVVLDVPLRGVPTPPLNTLKSNYYIIYPFFVTDGSFTRFCGVFDEPGVVGTTSLILLYIEKFNFKRVGNIVLLISGLLSLSLFFYLALGLFLVFQIFSTDIKIRRKIFLFLSMVAGIVFVVSNPTTNEYIIQRTQWDADKGSISGDNRAHAKLVDYMESIRGTHEYYFGTKSKDILLEFADSASLQNAVLRYGIIVVLLYFVFYALYANSYLGIGWKWLLFMAFIFMVLYNRPTMFNITRQFLFNLAIFAYVDQFSPQNIV